MSGDHTPSRPVLTAFDEHEQRKREQLKSAYKQRKAIRGKIYKNAAGNEGAHESLMGELSRQMRMNAETWPYVVLWDYIFAALHLVTGFHYWMQAVNFEKAKEERVAYVPDANGNLPAIYPVDENGVPDYTQDPVPADLVTRELIRDNQYEPEPNYEESLYLNYYELVGSLYGKQVPPEYAQKALYGPNRPGAPSGNDEKDREERFRQQQLLANRQKTVRNSPSGR